MTYACTLYWKTLRSLKRGKKHTSRKGLLSFTRWLLYKRMENTHKLNRSSTHRGKAPSPIQKGSLLPHAHDQIPGLLLCEPWKKLHLGKKNKIHLCLFDWRSTEINLRIIWIVFTWRHGRHIYQGRPKDLRWCAMGEIFKEIPGAVVFQDQAVCGF